MDEVKVCPLRLMGMTSGDVNTELCKCVQEKCMWWHEHEVTIGSGTLYRCAIEHLCDPHPVHTEIV